MYVYHGFGQAAYAVTVVGTAAANVAVNANHAIKVAKLQRGFVKHLETDQQKVAYVKILLLRLQSLSSRLGKGGRYRPGTKGFEVILAKALKNDMFYRGYCKADLYVPYTTKDTPGIPRDIWASITRTGHVEKGNVPKDVGPIWATGCKNAEDEARMAYISKFKRERKHAFLKTHKEDIGTLNLFLRFGTGLFLAMVMAMMIKVQMAVVKEQRPTIPKKRRKKKPTT